MTLKSVTQNLLQKITCHQFLYAVQPWTLAAHLPLVDLMLLLVNSSCLMIWSFEPPAYNPIRDNEKSTLPRSLEAIQSLKAWLLARIYALDEGDQDGTFFAGTSEWFCCPYVSCKKVNRLYVSGIYQNYARRVRIPLFHWTISVLCLWSKYRKPRFAFTTAVGIHKLSADDPSAMVRSSIR